MNRNKLLTFTIALLFAYGTCFGQERELPTKLYFRRGGFSVESDFSANKQALERLLNTINRIKNDSTLILSKIEITASTSPEGSFASNQLLNSQRIQAVESYIMTNTSVSDSLIVKLDAGVGWDKLRQLVVESKMQYSDEVLHVMDNTPETIYKNGMLVDGRNHQLMNLKWGRPYFYMAEHFFPQLRNSSVVNIYYKRDTIVPKQVKPLKIVEPIVVVAAPVVVAPVFVVPVVVAPVVVAPMVVETKSSVRKPLFAIKTNMLYLAAITPNLELEVPIGDRWSVAGEMMYGWWKKDDNTFCWQVLSVGLEGRYWFGDRDKHRPLSGWFAGVFASAGLYDFQLKPASGVQGEFYLLTGVSGGYVLPVSESLSLEFSTGVGYMINDYQKYTVIENKYLIKDGPKRRFQSLLPAKLKVSLVWTLFGKSKRGGAR